MKAALTIFVSVFLAELGDKTQLATLLFATDRDRSPVLVFAAAGGALLLSTLLAVVLGRVAASKLESWPLDLLAGLAFMGLGGWMVVSWLLANRA